MKVNVLALDIEGGHGGSSRSLYTTVQHLDREEVNIEVWCKRPGKIKDAYTELGVTCIVEPTMPKVTSVLPLFSRNFYVHLQFIYNFIGARKFRAKLVETVNKRFDVVHFNHESLAWLGAWLRRRTNVGMVFHNRTRLIESVFASAQIRVMDTAADRLVFISENERDNVRKLGAKTLGDIIYNPIKKFQQIQKQHDFLSSDSRFKVCSLSNYGWNRGVDRLIEIAQVLKKMGRNDVVIVVAGDMALSGNLPGDLGLIGRKRGNLSDYAKLKDVNDMFIFLGHVNDPESILFACDSLVKPTRESNPWGRDILESMSMGKPVISIGSYDVFVKNDVTGYLFSEYNAENFAHKIIHLIQSPEKRKKMGLRAQQLVEAKCNGFKQAKELTDVWIKALRM